MSLESLRQLRRAGEKPTGIVKVVVGKRKPAIEGDADVISVLAGDEPALMDWRAVVGLPLALFVAEQGDGWIQGEQAYDAVRAAGAKVLGVVWRDTIIAPASAVRVLRRLWEVVCL